jgi:hypothetical protein
MKYYVAFHNSKCFVNVAVFIVAVLSPPIIVVNMNGLKVGYYHHMWLEKEAIVSGVVAKKVKENLGVATSLIEMHFQDFLCPYLRALATTKT